LGEVGPVIIFFVLGGNGIVLVLVLVGVPILALGIVSIRGGGGSVIGGGFGPGGGGFGCGIYSVVVRPIGFCT
jgi:hypothetical protein